MGDPKRCPAFHPDTGEQCGGYEGHYWHTLLIPTDAPWFPGKSAAAPAPDAERAGLRSRWLAARSSMQCALLALDEGCEDEARGRVQAALRDMPMSDAALLAQLAAQQDALRAAATNVVAAYFAGSIGVTLSDMVALRAALATADAERDEEVDERIKPDEWYAELRALRSAFGTANTGEGES